MIRKAFKVLIGYYKFSRHWKNYLRIQRLHNPERIRKFKQIHKGKTIFCVGAGPSLSLEDPGLLDNQVIIFTHSSYKILDKIKSPTAYWLVQDQNRLKEFKDVDRNIFSASFRTIHNIQSFESATISKKDVFIKPEIHFHSTRWLTVPRAIATGLDYSEDISDKFCLAGDSIIFTAMQLAFYMGANRIVMLGVDMNYGSGNFDSYFDKTQVESRTFWPINYDKGYAKKAFEVYNKWLVSKGIELINASKKTKEDVTKKMTLEEVINV